MGQTKVVLDTNILISALGWNGKPNRIFQRCIDKELELIICQEQIEEVLRVIEYPKFSFTKEQKELFISIILEIATLVEITGKVDIIKKDPDDNIILEAALVGNVCCIVSGDPHLLELKTFADIKIMTASEFLQS